MGNTYLPHMFNITYAWQVENNSNFIVEEHTDENAHETYVLTVSNRSLSGDTLTFKQSVQDGVRLFVGDFGSKLLCFTGVNQGGWRWYLLQ